MICDRCGCNDTHVIRTIRKEDSVVRVRRCTACAKTIETIEHRHKAETEPEPQPTPAKKKTPRKKKPAGDKPAGALEWAMGETTSAN